jgi:hypothetical protein
MLFRAESLFALFNGPRLSSEHTTSSGLNGLDKLHLYRWTGGHVSKDT